jgi:hypothetical protein
MRSSCRPPDFWLPALVLALACSRYEPLATPASIPTGALAVEPMRRHLYAIADDSMEGRGAGTAGNARAIAYIANEFAHLGLVPAGEQGGFLQRVPLVERAVDSSSVISAGDVSLPVGDEFMPISLPIVGRIEGREIILGGDLTDTSSWLDASAARERIVVLSVPIDQRAFRSLGPVTGDPRFQRAAALGVVQLELLRPGRANEIGGTFQRYLSPHVANARPTQNVPLFYLSRRGAARLFGTPLEQLRTGDLGTLGRVTLDLVPRERVPMAGAHNVIAILPGSDPALRDEFVVIGAHNDHLGLATAAVDHDSLRAFNTVMRPLGANDAVRTPTGEEQARIAALVDSLRRERPARRDSTFNGAMDDGGGTATLLGIAEALRTRAPRRSVLFISHAAEETGLLGSAWFMAFPTVARSAIVAMINLDSFGGDGRAPGAGTASGTYVQLTGARRRVAALGRLIDSLNAARALPLALDETLDAPSHALNKYCRSDHANFAAFGIPVAFFSTGFNRDYHQVTDEPQYTDFDYLARVGGFVRDLALALANRAERLRPPASLTEPTTPCRQ